VIMNGNIFFKNEIANSNQSIAEKTTTIQEDYIKILKCDEGLSKNIYLIKKDNIHNNNLQVINQYATEDGLPAPHSGQYCIYVLKCADNSFYIGQTDNF